MAYIVNMPKLGLEMEEGTVLEWKIEEGEEVEEGQVVAEIESEKSIGEVEAREDGVLRRIYVEVDETVPPGTPIGIVAAADADIGDLESEAERELADATGEGEVEGEGPPDSADAETTGDAEPASTSGSEPADATASRQSESSAEDVKASPRATKRAEELGVDLSTVEGTGPQGSVTADDVEAAASSSSEDGETADDVRASPRAKKRAEELGVDLVSVEGTGPQGSVTADDVEAAADSGEGEAAESAGKQVVESTTQSRERGRAERIVPDQPEQYRYARSTAVLDADAVDVLFDAKHAVENALDVDASVTDVLLVVLSETLREVPEMNATFEESTHHLHESLDVALVAPVPDDEGLTTSVVSDLDERSFSDLVAARRDVDGGSDADDEPTATFTVADASDFDDGPGRLVNRPAVAALEVDVTGQRAVPAENGVDLRSHVRCGLTYDTRAVDRRVVERFVDSLEENARDATDLVMRSYLR